MDLPEDLIALLHQPSLCYFATLMPDGSPQITQTWVDTDGEHIVINTVQGFQKLKNVERDPRVAVSVSDPSNLSHYLRGPRAGRGHHHQRRCGAHRGPRPTLPRRSLPLVRGPRPSPCRPHHQRGEDPRDGLGEGPRRLGHEKLGNGTLNPVTGDLPERSAMPLQGEVSNEAGGLAEHDFPGRRSALPTLAHGSPLRPASQVGEQPGFVHEQSAKDTYG